MILKGNFSAVPGGQREKLWREFLSDPSQWWDHGAEKVTEHHSCQSSHVNVAIALVGISLVARWWLLSYCGPNLGRNCFHILCTSGIIVVVCWRR
jgi:hypothetical protein